MNQHLKTAVVISRHARSLYTAAPSAIGGNSPFVLYDFSHSPRPSPRKVPHQQSSQQSQNSQPQSEQPSGSPATTLTSSYGPTPFSAQGPWLTGSTPSHSLPPPLWLCPPLDAAWFPLALGIDVGPGPWDVIRVTGKEKQPEENVPREKEVPWSLECGAFGIAKSKGKRKPGSTAQSSAAETEDLGLSVQVGEDSYFVRPDALGVADGVGGWAHHAHADSARFARMLMHNCASELANPSQSSSTPTESSTKRADSSTNVGKAYPSPPQTPKKPTTSANGSDSLHPSRLAEALSSMTLSADGTTWTPISPTSPNPSGSLPTPPESAPVPVSPREILHAAYERTVATFRATGTAGSSTALVAVLRDGELSVAHLGDCMLAVVRDGKFVVRTEEMQHSFNFPYQLGPHSATTPRADAQMITERVVPGDIVILASDGLGDNLWDEEVLMEVEQFVRGSQSGDSAEAPIAIGEKREITGDPAVLGEALARRAKAAAGGNTDVPFGVRGRAAGFHFVGGKTDDISVVVAVVRGPASASVPASS